MEHTVLYDNNYLFGNLIIEGIPHPAGIIGLILKYLSVVCHFAGGTIFFVVLLPFIYICYDKRFGIKLGFALLTSGIINGFFKFIGHSYRPIGLSDSILAVQDTLIKETSFGFPSGHSHVSILIWGLLFIYFKNRWMRILSLFFIIFTPFSRIYAGVHYPGDVLGGFTMGLLQLLFTEWLFKKFPEFPHLKEKSELTTLRPRSLSLLLIVLTLPFILLEKGQLLEQELSSIEQIITAGGSLAGFFTGVFYIEFGSKTYNWAKPNTLRDMIIRITLIFLAILLFYFILGKLVKTFAGEDPLLRYIRYYILNLIIVLGIPYILEKMKHE